MLRIAVLVGAGLLFAGMGAYALVAPARLAAPFRLDVTTPESRSEIRAVYGGFGLAMAATLWWAATDAGGPHTGAVWAVGAALAGMAVGRVVSRVFDSATPFYPLSFYLLVEAVGAAALLAVA